MTGEQAVRDLLARNGAREPDALTAEIIHVLKGHGWRETVVRATVTDWRARRAPDPPNDEYRRWREANGI